MAKERLGRQGCAPATTEEFGFFFAEQHAGQFDGDVEISFSAGATIGVRIAQKFDDVLIVDAQFAFDFVAGILMFGTE